MTGERRHHKARWVEGLDWMRVEDNAASLAAHQNGPAVFGSAESRAFMRFATSNRLFPLAFQGPHSYLVSPRLFMMPRQRRKHRARSQAVVTASFASCGQLIVRIYFSLAVLVSWGSQGGLLFEGAS
jgi:hypothetical protein